MLRRLHVSAAATVIIALSTTAAFSQGKEYSGAWESQTNPRIVWTIDQSSDGIKLHVVRGLKRDIKTVTWLFGKPSRVPDAVASSIAETTATIENGTIIFDGSLSGSDQPARIVETWELNSAADKLTVTTKVHGANNKLVKQQTFRRRE